MKEIKNKAQKKNEDSIVDTKPKKSIKEKMVIESEVITKSKDEKDNLNKKSIKIKKTDIEIPKKDEKKNDINTKKDQKKKKFEKIKEKTKEVRATLKKQGEKYDSYSDFAKGKQAKLKKIRAKIIKDLSLDKIQIKKATKALLNYHENSKNKFNLLDAGDEFIYLEIALSKVPTKYSIRPVQIKLPTPIYGPQYQSRFCIFSSDPQRQFKDKLADLNVPCIAKVIGYSKLVKKYGQYQDKRKLLYDFDQFFCDHKIYNMLRKPTGKVFYQRKKIPYPIDCEKIPDHLEFPTYEDYLNDLSNYTYFSMGNGPVYTIKVARVNMSIKDIVKNIIHGFYNTIPHILQQQQQEGLDHTVIRQLSIKTLNSISLPILNQLTSEELMSYVSMNSGKSGHGEDDDDKMKKTKKKEKKNKEKIEESDDDE